MAFLYRLLPPRPTFAQDMSQAEAEVMERHVGYWQDLLGRDVALVFGPVLDPEEQWGLGVLDLDDEQAARAIGESDPAVQSGTCSYEVAPMELAQSEPTGGGQVIYLAPGGGRVYEQGGFRGAIKVDDAESDGRQCFSEWAVDAGDDGPPPHLHRDHQEAFFVVEGTLTFRAGEETIEAEAGSFIFIPPGVVHTFSNRSDAPARCVNAYAPGGIEGFFIEVGRAVADGEPDPAEIERLSAQYDVFFPEG